jgi:hypothetical protein
MIEERIEEPLAEWERELLERKEKEDYDPPREMDCPVMVKRFYMIREIPAEKVGKGQFEAPSGWDLFCLWANEGKTYGVFEKVEDV